MHTWKVQEAKAHFSELLDACIKEGPQLVTRRGEDTAVVVPIAEWKRLIYQAPLSIKALLLSDMHRVDFEIPKRGRKKHRAKLIF